MSSKLAGQRAKFSRAKRDFSSTSDETGRLRAAQKMAEVIAQAPANGFTEADVTQGEEVPEDARLLATGIAAYETRDDDPDALVAAVQSTVVTDKVIELGQGCEFVYAYGYRCCPDRIKIGSCTGDVVTRIAAQIYTGTPDKPVLHLRIRTHDCRALERILHGVFQLRGRRVTGAGAEWFLAKPDEVVAVYEKAVG